MSIALAMIVKDEQTVIGDLLESVKPVIDCWTIIDTGSSDDTKKIIRKALKGKPGRLLDRPFVNFGHNRTELLNEARGQGADYLLMMDADMVLHHNGAVPNLTADEYVIHFDGAFDMGLPLLLKDGRGWYYKGSAHAYLCCDDGLPIAREILREWTIEAREDNRPRREKFERDALLLEAEIPTRSVFYLAQTYRDLGHSKEAADLYRLRVRLSAQHPEEVFWACYQEGCLRLESDFAAGVSVLLEAWQRRPTRAEPLYVAGRAFRHKGWNEVALLVLQKAASLPYPDDHLFLLRDVYEWKIELEICHTLIALGRLSEARWRLRELQKRPEPVASYATNTLAGVEGQEPKTKALSPKDVSAVVVTRGNVDLEPIIETLPYDDIVIWDNSKRPFDAKVYGRYLAIAEAKNDVIYFQDDDLVFTAHDALLAAYEPGVLISNMWQPWVEACGYTDLLCLVGAGAICDRDLPARTFDRYLAHHPMDDDFLLECDFCFGTMAPWKRLDLGFLPLEHADAPDRLYQQPWQFGKKQAMVARARALV